MHHLLEYRITVMVILGLMFGPEWMGLGQYVGGSQFPVPSAITSM